MPISLNELKKKDVRNKRQELISFLKAHNNEAFRSTELSKLVNIPESYLNPLLNDLKKAGIVQHKKPYWHYKQNGKED